MTPERFARAAATICSADDPMYVALMLRVHVDMAHYQARSLREIAQLEIARRSS